MPFYDFRMVAYRQESKIEDMKFKNETLLCIFHWGSHGYPNMVSDFTRSGSDRAG